MSDYMFFGVAVPLMFITPLIAFCVGSYFLSKPRGKKNKLPDSYPGHVIYVPLDPSGKSEDVDKAQLLDRLYAMEKMLVDPVGSPYGPIRLTVMATLRHEIQKLEDDLKESREGGDK